MTDVDTGNTGIHAALRESRHADDTWTCILLRRSGLRQERAFHHDAKLVSLAWTTVLLVCVWLFDVLWSTWHGIIGDPAYTRSCAA